MRIEWGADDVRYYDMNGDQIHENDYVVMEDGKIEKVYLTEDGYLGTDATNPSWIERGLAVPCQFGIYPFCVMDKPVLMKGETK